MSTSWLATVAQFFQIATPLVGGAAVYVASRAIKTNREIARDKATFDFILKLQTDEKMLSAHKNCNDAIETLQLKENPIDLDSKVAKQELNKIHDFLNIYEFMALAIERGTISEDVIKKYYRSTIIRKIETCMPVIQKVRKDAGVPRAYIEVEALVERWKRP